MNRGVHSLGLLRLDALWGFRKVGGVDDNIDERTNVHAVKSVSALQGLDTDLPTTTMTDAQAFGCTPHSHAV